MERRGLLGLLRRQPAVDEATFVEPPGKARSRRRRASRRADSRSPVGELARRRRTGRSANSAPATSIVSPVTRLMCAWLIGSIHSPAWPALYSQLALAGCTWMTPCTVPTVSARRRSRGTSTDATGLRHLHEPRLKDRQAHVCGEAPVAEAHDPRTHAGRDLVELAHVRLRGLVLPAVLDESPDRDPVHNEGDVEHREPERGQPERPLRKALTREWTLYDPRQYAPGEARGEQRSTADDHHVRAREVAHEMTGVAHARERFGDCGHVLDDHVHAAEHEEEPAGDEVFRELAVVRSELVVRVRLSPDRRLAPRQHVRDRADEDCKEREVRQELERRDVAEIHAPGGPSAGRARGSRP